MAIHEKKKKTSLTSLTRNLLHTEKLLSGTSKLLFNSALLMYLVCHEGNSTDTSKLSGRGMWSLLHFKLLEWLKGLQNF